MEAAQKTDYILAAIQEEMEEVGTKDANIYICGDLNAEPEDVPIFYDLAQNHGWQDLGEKADIWGKSCCEPTCKAPSATQESRRDCILVNPEAFTKIEDFEVIRCDTFSVHQPIQIKIEVESLEVTKDVLYKPTDAKDKFEDKVEKCTTKANNASTMKTKASTKQRRR